MDTAALVIALVGIVLSLFTTITAMRRGSIFWREYAAAKNEPHPGPLYTIELQTARDLAIGHTIRVVGYSSIFLIFGSFLTNIFPDYFPEEGSRAGRIFLTALTLIAFFVEENYLIRAKRHWAEMLKELRNGGP